MGITGWSGSGKTTLLTAVLPVLRLRGLRISTIKHAHHALDLDRPGKDSFRHREAGAIEVLVAGSERWALMRETPQDSADATPDLRDLARRLAPVDLVLVEGFKAYDFPKIEVFRPSLGKPPLWPNTRGIVAVATDALAATLPALDIAVLDLVDPSAVAVWIIDWMARQVLSD